MIRNRLCILALIAIIVLAGCSDGMRHLFLESPYYSCEFLNIWMQEEGDEILDAVYDDLEGTASYVPATKEFYKKIKEQCPETIFHGTDVGHQFWSTG